MQCIIKVEVLFWVKQEKKMFAEWQLALGLGLFWGWTVLTQVSGSSGRSCGELRLPILLQCSTITQNAIHCVTFPCTFGKPHRLLQSFPFPTVPLPVSVSVLSYGRRYFHCLRAPVPVEDFFLFCFPYHQEEKWMQQHLVTAQSEWEVSHHGLADSLRAVLQSLLIWQTGSGQLSTFTSDTTKQQGSPCTTGPGDFLTTSRHLGSICKPIQICP